MNYAFSPPCPKVRTSLIRTSSGSTCYCVAMRRTVRWFHWDKPNCNFPPLYRGEASLRILCTCHHPLNCRAFLCVPDPFQLTGGHFLNNFPIIAIVTVQWTWCTCHSFTSHNCWGQYQLQLPGLQEVAMGTSNGTETVGM